MYQKILSLGQYFSIHSLGSRDDDGDDDDDDDDVTNVGRCWEDSLPSSCCLLIAGCRRHTTRSICISDHFCICISDHFCICISNHFCICISNDFCICISIHFCICIHVYICMDTINTIQRRAR